MMRKKSKMSKDHTIHSFNHTANQMGLAEGILHSLSMIMNRNDKNVPAQKGFAEDINYKKAHQENK